jgi:hypothetical protein
MSEVDYQANVPGINRGVKELESLADRAGHLRQKYISDYEATSGWQGSPNRGDSLADSLTPALEREFADVQSALEGIEGALRGLYGASNMGGAVRKPSDDAAIMINDAQGRH